MSSSPTCGGVAPQPVRDPLLRQILAQSPRAQKMVPGIEEELAPTGLVNQGADQGPQDGEHPRGPDYQHPAQGLGVVGLADLDNVKQGLHPRPPQVAHVQTI